MSVCTEKWHYPQVWNIKCPLPVRGICLCVCKQGAYHLNSLNRDKYQFWVSLPYIFFYKMLFRIPSEDLHIAAKFDPILSRLSESRCYESNIADSVDRLLMKECNWCSLLICNHLKWIKAIIISQHRLSKHVKSRYRSILQWFFCKIALMHTTRSLFLEVMKDKMWQYEWHTSKLNGPIFWTKSHDTELCSSFSDNRVCFLKALAEPHYWG